MSEWFYIRLVFGLTWGTLVGYTFLLNRRRIAAQRALNELDGGTP